MAKIKQKYLAFKTAERNFNNKKVALSNEFSKRLHELVKENKLEAFERVAEDMVDILGKEYLFTVTSIKVLYGLD